MKGPVKLIKTPFSIETFSITLKNVTLRITTEQDGSVLCYVLLMLSVSETI